MVRQGVGLVDDPRGPRHPLGRIYKQRHQPRRVALECQTDHLSHQAQEGEQFLLGVLRGGRRLGAGPTAFLPHLGPLETILEFADTREVLVEPFAVTGRQRLVEAAGAGGDEIEDAATGAKRLDLLAGFLWRSLEEHLPVEPGRAPLAGQEDTVTRERQARRPLSGHGERQARKPRLRAETLGSELIERDGIAEAAAGRMGGACEEGDVGRMASVDVGVGEPGADGEPVAERLEGSQVGGGGVVVADPLRKEALRQQSHRCLDGHQPQRRAGLGGLGPTGGKRLEPGKGNSHAAGAEEGASGDGRRCGERHEEALHCSRNKGLETTAWIIVRTPPPAASTSSTRRSRAFRSVAETSAPVA